MHVCINIFCNNRLEEGKGGLIGSHSYWISWKEKKYRMQNCVSFRMDNETEQSFLNYRSPHLSVQNAPNG